MKLSDLIREVFKEQGYPMEKLDTYVDCCGPAIGNRVYIIDNAITINIDDTDNTFKMYGMSSVRGPVNKTWNASDPNCINEFIQSLRTYCPTFKWKGPLPWRPL